MIPPPMKINEENDTMPWEYKIKNMKPTFPGQNYEKEGNQPALQSLSSAGN